jgi:hypothetical protein
VGVGSGAVPESEAAALESGACGTTLNRSADAHAASMANDRSTVPTVPIAITSTSTTSTSATPTSATPTSATPTSATENDGIGAPPTPTSDDGSSDAERAFMSGPRKV